MVAFDAEVYLRRLGERLLDHSDQQQPGHWSALRGAAAALVVAGAIAADEAWWGYNRMLWTALRRKAAYLPG